MDAPSAPLHPSMALGAYCAALVGGRRVALIGDGQSGLAQQLAEASRRRVHVLDPDRQRVAACVARGASDVGYAVLGDELGLREGSFDAVLVPELIALPDPPRAVELARSLASRRGFALIATPNVAKTDGRRSLRAAIGYFELYDLVSGAFGHVRMLGQAPFVGFTVADFAAGDDPAVTIDTSLMQTSEEPRWFVALASEEPLELDPYVLVELPIDDAAPLLFAAEREIDEDTRTALAEARLQATALKSELDSLRERHKSEAERAHAHDARVAGFSARVAELEQQISALRARHARDLEAQADAHQEDLDRMLERIAELEAGEDERVRAPDEPTITPVIEEKATTAPPDDRATRAFEFQLAELKRALAEARGQRDSANERAARVAVLERELAELRAERAQAGPVAATAEQAEIEAEHAREIDELESRLRERGAELEALRRELREAERIGRELVAKLAERPATTGDGDVRLELDVVAQRCARAEADLQAAQWRVAELSSRLEPPPEPSVEQARLEEALRVAHEELAQLRRDMAAR